MRKARKKARFFRGLMIYAVSVTVLIAIGLALFWCYIAEYERSLPEKAMEAGLAVIADRMLPAMIDEAFSIELSEFESRESLHNYFLAAEDGIRYEKRAAEYQAARPVYTIVGGCELAKAELEASGKTRFGFTIWKCGRVTPLPALTEAQTKTVRLKVPSDATVTLNGVTAGDKYIVSTEKYDRPVIWERDSGTLPDLCLYEIGGLYAEPVICVNDAAGRELSGTEEDGVLFYDFPDSARHSLTLLVPHDASVKVGGVPLTESEISAGKVAYPDMSELNEAAAFVPYRVEYKIDGLLTEPDITVEAGGAALIAEAAEEHKYTYGYPEARYHTLNLTVPDGCTVKVNGVDITGKYTTQTVPADPECAEIEALIKNPLMLTGYVIGGLYASPSVEVTDTKGNRIPLTENGTDCYVYELPASDELAEECGTAVGKFIDAYLVYTVNGWYDNDAHYADMMKHVLSGSQAYKKLAATKFSFAQNHQFTLVSREIKTYGCRRLGDNCFSCIADIDTELHRWTTVYDSVEGMKLYFINEGSQWLLAKLII